MRITAEAKTATHKRILETAAGLFTKTGWEAATTREIAAAAGIATGTLFNYFQSKEAIAAALIGESLGRAQEEFVTRAGEDGTLEEDLFRFIWGGLKSLRPYRKFLAPAAEIIFSPLAQGAPDRAGDSIRAGHLEAVERMIAAHGVAGPLPAVIMQLYWTLYLGVLAYWAADASPHQEETLALLDRSLALFIFSMRREHDQRKSG